MGTAELKKINRSVSSSGFFGHKKNPQGCRILKITSYFYAVNNKSVTKINNPTNILLRTRQISQGSTVTGAICLKTKCGGQGVLSVTSVVWHSLGNFGRLRYANSFLRQDSLRSFLSCCLIPPLTIYMFRVKKKVKKHNRKLFLELRDVIKVECSYIYLKQINLFRVLEKVKVRWRLVYSFQGKRSKEYLDYKSGKKGDNYKPPPEFIPSIQQWADLEGRISQIFTAPTAHTARFK